MLARSASVERSMSLLQDARAQAAARSMTLVPPAPRPWLPRVLEFEERDPIARTRAARLSARFAPLFQHFLTTYHPDQPGEVRGKSSNLTWAARQVEAELIAPGRLDPQHLIVTVCDADSRLHR